MGKNRTMSICLSDIPKDKIVKHTNGKLYLPLQTYDLNEPDRFGNDFSISVQFNEDEKKRKKEGEQVNRVFLGNGKIWPDIDNTQPATEKDTDDLPF